MDPSALPFFSEVKDRIAKKLRVGKGIIFLNEISGKTLEVESSR